MPNTKKYVSLDKLSLYDEKIKAKIAADDAATLASAKSYADGLAVNYDATGAAATAEANAKAYADGKDAAIAAAQKAGDDAAAAAKAADDKAVAAQGAVDELAEYVGTIPSTATATDVVGYINEKTSGIASEGAMTELSNRVTAVEGDVATIKGDYLKLTDKTALETAIAAKADQTALDAEVTARGQAITALDNKLTPMINGKVAQTDYDTKMAALDQKDADLVAEDARIAGLVDTNAQAIAQEKTDREGAVSELNDKIDGKVAQADYDAKVAELVAEDSRIAGLVGDNADAIAANTEAIEVLNGEGTGSVKKTVDDALNEFATNVTNDGVVNSYKELIDYAAEHGGEFTTLVGEVDALQETVGSAESGLVKKVNDIDAAYKDADTTLQGNIDALSGVVDTKAAQSDLEALGNRVTTAEGEIDTLQSEMDAVEAAIAEFEEITEAEVNGLFTA